LQVLDSELRLLTPTDPEGRAAGAAAADARQRIARAVEALRTAVASGYKDWGLLQADPDLAALRQEPEFQALLKDAGRP
jgi:hypothetical protein